MANDTGVRDKPSPDIAPRKEDIGALEALWVFFSSMKTAITLLLILAVASIAGTVIEQNQPAEVYVKAYGENRYAVLKSLGLTDVYHSTWFTILLGLIGVNLAICSINRFGAAWRRTFRPDVAVEPGRVEGMSCSRTFAADGSADDAAGRVVGALRARGYHVTREDGAHRVSVYASRGRISVWGPYLTHLSILVIFVGAILGGVLGFEGFTAIEEGGRVSGYRPDGSEQTRDLGFSVALKSFAIAHDQRRQPTGYKSDLAVYEGERQVARKAIDVNHPLSYKGISFFQSSYGLARMVVTVTGPNGQSERLEFELGSQDTPRGTAYGIVGETLRQVRFGDRKLTVFAHNLVPDYVGGKRINASMLPLNPAANVMVNERFPEYKGLDAWESLGWLTTGESAEHDGFTVTVEDFVKFTGLQVTSNPALPVVYVGFALMILGVFVSFYVTHRIIRASVSPGPSGASVVVGAQSRAEADTFDKDFERIRGALA